MLASARNPFEIVMILAGLLAGIAGLVVPGSGARVIYNLLPHYAQVFNACLVLGTGTVAVSLFLRPPMTLLIERVGMIWLAGLLLPYGIAIVCAVSVGFHPLGLLILGYGLACAARVLQITRDLQRYRQELRRVTGDSR
jgi:hypothetical protein